MVCYTWNAKQQTFDGMDVLYIAASDPNSHGFTLKHYWEKFGLGTFTQISRPRPSGKPVDITFDTVQEGEEQYYIQIPDGSKLYDQEAREYVGNLAARADVIHLDRPRMKTLTNEDKNWRLPPIRVKKKSVSWHVYLKNKPCVFNYRGSLLLKSFNNVDLRKAWRVHSHAVPVFCNPHLQPLLPTGSMMLPFCGNEHLYSSIKPKRSQKRFVATHASTSRGTRCRWLFKKGYWKNLSNIIENIGDFEGAGDAGGDESFVIDLQNFTREHGITMDFLRSMPYQECLRHIAQADCHFDNYRFFGSYGHSALEAMFYGKPVLNGVSKLFLSVMGESPFLQTESMEHLQTNLLELKKDPALYEEYAAKSKSFYERFHRPDVVVGDYLIPIYQAAIERFKKRQFSGKRKKTKRKRRSRFFFD